MVDESLPPGTSTSSNPVRATLEVDPHVRDSCPLIREAPNAQHVTQQFVWGPTGWTTCLNEVTTCEGGATRTAYVSVPITDQCAPCVTLDRSGCVAAITAIRDGVFVVSVTARDREQFSTMAETLQSAGATVRVQRIGRAEEDSACIEIDASDVTPKQLEAIEVAVASGYYDRPPSTDLDDVAEQLGVSKSAASQRLNAVESILAKALALDLTTSSC